MRSCILRLPFLDNARHDAPLPTRLNDARDGGCDGVNQSDVSTFTSACFGTTTVSDFSLLECLQHGTAIHATGLQRSTSTRAATVRGLIIVVDWLFTRNSSTTPNAGTHSAKKPIPHLRCGLRNCNPSVLMLTKDKNS